MRYGVNISVRIPYLKELRTIKNSDYYIQQAYKELKKRYPISESVGCKLLADLAGYSDTSIFRIIRAKVREKI